jgi:hypothetical protein
MDGVANEVNNRRVNSREMAVLEIDTRLDAYSTKHLRSAVEIESLIAQADVLLTTRLHGLVLALASHLCGGRAGRPGFIEGFPILFDGRIAGKGKTMLRACSETLQ